MTFKIANIILIVFIILFVIAWVIYLTQKNKWNIKKTTDNKIKWIFTAISIVMAITAIIYASILITAVNHGMHDKNTPVSTAISNISTTPVEDKTLPENTEGSLIILYKFNCGDCKAIYPELTDILKDNNSVYWISSQSKLGKELTDRYQITDVPTGLYMRVDDYNGAVTATKYFLADTDENNNTILNQPNINRLLYLQSEKR